MVDFLSSSHHCVRDSSMVVMRCQKEVGSGNSRDEAEADAFLGFFFLAGIKAGRRHLGVCALLLTTRQKSWTTSGLLQPVCCDSSKTFNMWEELKATVEIFHLCPEAWLGLVSVEVHR